MANSDAATEFIADLVGEIEVGLYDSHLRRIARACYKRRGSLEDGVGVIDSAVESAVVPTVTEEDAENNEPPMTAHNLWASNPAQASVVPKGVRTSDAFRWNGVRYYKSSINGRYIYFGPNYRPAKYRKMTIVVESIYIEGTSRAKVKVLASDTTPRMVGQTFTVSRNMLMKILLGTA